MIGWYKYMFGEILLNKLKECEIIIYGAGNNGLYTFHYLKSYGIDILGFADIKSSSGSFLIEGKII